MKRQAKLMIWVLAVTAISAYAQSRSVNVSVDEFEVSPIQVYAGDTVTIRFRVRNVGSEPVTIKPRIRFTRPGMSMHIKTDQPVQTLAPSQAFDFTAKTKFPFSHAYGLAPFGPYEVDVIVRDPKTETALGGALYTERLQFLRKRVEPAPPPVPAEPIIVAYPNQSLYFVGETVSITGRVMNARERVKRIYVSGAEKSKYKVARDGRFKLKLRAKTDGLQEIIIRAKGIGPTAVPFFVTDGELEFPNLFGTDRTYEVGIFTGAPRDNMEMFPYWVHRLGIRFYAFVPGGGLRYQARLDRALDNADELGMTVGLIGEDDCLSMPGAENTITKDGKRDGHWKNLLSEKWQRPFMERVTGLVRQLRHHRSFRYLLLMPEWLNNRTFQGYNPENLERFAKVLGAAYPALKLPSTKDAPAWYKLLRGDETYWEMWMGWRERIWTDYLVTVRDALRAIKPDLEFGTCESNFMHRGLWNKKMLAAEGITVHAPHTNFPHGDPYWTTFIGRDWYRLRYGFDALFVSLGIWADVNYEPELIPNGLLGVVKAGGTRIPAWCDSGFRARWRDLNAKFGQGGARKIEEYANIRIDDCAQQSAITDMLVGVDGHRKVRALERTVAQIGRLPYKDRFDLYERNGGTLPIEFDIRWSEHDRTFLVEAEDGTHAGDPHQSVYATVQDWHRNGYVEMFVFNDGEQAYRSIRLNAVRLVSEAYSLVPGSLAERDLTLTIRGSRHMIPFVDGRPWMHYSYDDGRIVIKSIPFKKQQVRLVQLINCGRELPHVTQSPIGISETMLNIDKKQLWVKFTGADTGEMTVDCADWGPTEQIANGELPDFDSSTRVAKIKVKAAARTVTISWP